MNAPFVLPKATVPKRLEAWFGLTPYVRLDLDGMYLQVHDGSWAREPQAPGMVFGGRATCLAEPTLSTAAHEMAHLVDIDDRRATKRGWGLKHGKTVTILGRTYAEMQTGQGVERELMVTAIQATIIEHCGFEFDYLFYAHVLRHVDGYLFWRNDLGMTYEDERDPSGLDVFDRDTSIADHIGASIIMSIRQTLSIEVIWAEWARKAFVVERQIKRSVFARSQL